MIQMFQFGRKKVAAFTTAKISGTVYMQSDNQIYKGVQRQKKVFNSLFFVRKEEMCKHIACLSGLCKPITQLE